ncbi:MAG: L,D-transpeptidase family protein [Gammaproteobacteria bacterium]|nr:L,D-transpeptidase family protein [Gammaproteobacteria bacterium]
MHKKISILMLLAMMSAADAALFPLPAPDIDVVGSLVLMNTEYEDTFVSLGQTHGLGYEELISANPGVDPWLPGERTEILLPKLFVLPDAPRDGIVLNLAEMRMYFYREEQGQATVQTFPVSVGRIDRDTPTGRTEVVDKVRNPTWYPPQSIIDEKAEMGETLPRVVPPGEDNPLGKFAMQLGIRGYLIHGTNRPAGIGMRVTHGCIRLLPADIERLFDQVPRGTAVHIVNQPYKMGWVGDTLFLEVHRPFADDNTHVERGMTAIVELYVRATRERKALIDWDVVQQVYEQAHGIPVPVSGEMAAASARMSGWCAANAAVPLCRTTVSSAQ